MIGNTKSVLGCILSLLCSGAALAQESSNSLESRLDGIEQRIEASRLIPNALTGASLAAAIILGYWGIHINRAQLKKREEQLDDAKTRQQYYQTITWMMEGFPDADRVLSLEGKNFKSWGPDDFEAARRMCYRFHILGVMIRRRMMNEVDICHTWYYSIQKCYVILQPYVQSMRSTRDPRYYSGMDYLGERTAENCISFVGFQSPTFSLPKTELQIERNIGAIKRAPDFTPIAPSTVSK